MIEQEWLVCTELDKMVEHLHRSDSDRKLRLFACACCRRVWNWLEDERSRRAVDAAERFAEEQATRGELTAAEGQAQAARLEAETRADEAMRSLNHQDYNWYAGQRSKAYAAAAAAGAAAILLWETVAAVAEYPVRIAEINCIPNLEAAWWGWDKPEAAAEAAASAAVVRQAACNQLRCIFGNPFRPVQVDPAWLSWRDGAAVHIAQAIYGERRFQDLPILADALEDAGCTNPDILQHCRQQAEHVRGCWVVDRVLGKT